MKQSKLTQLMEYGLKKKIGEEANLYFSLNSKRIEIECGVSGWIQVKYHDKERGRDHYLMWDGWDFGYSMISGKCAPIDFVREVWQLGNFHAQEYAVALQEVIERGIEALKMRGYSLGAGVIKATCEISCRCDAEAGLEIEAGTLKYEDLIRLLAIRIEYTFKDGIILA